MSSTPKNLTDFQTFFEECSDLLCIANEEGKFTKINKAWLQNLGYSEKDLIDKAIFTLVHPDDLAHTKSKLQGLVTNADHETKFENRYRKHDNSYVWLSWSARNKDGKLFLVAKDITEIKTNEMMLTEIQRQAKIGGWILDVKDFSTHWTDETYHIHELAIGTPTNKSKGIDFYHPAYQDKIRNFVRACVEKKQSYDDIFKIITAKGREIWVRTTGHPIVDERGKVTQLIGIFQDIDKLKNLSQDLESTNARLNDLLLNTPGMVYQFQLDLDGEMFFPYVSPKAFEIYEIAPEVFNEDSAIMLKMAHPDDLNDLQHNITLSAQKLEAFEWTGRIITKTKKIKWIKAKSIPQRTASGAILWNGIVVDITKEKELEQKLTNQQSLSEHSARLASLGKIAAGIGHEINNPLAIVMAYNQKIKKLIEELVPDRIEERKILDKQHEACERIKKIVSGLRHLAHSGQTEAHSNVDVCDSIKKTIDFVREIYAFDGVKIVFNSNVDEAFVNCSSIHIQQILLNLLSNAKDAMKHPHQENSTIVIDVQEQGNFWRLSVTDSGTGILPENHDKIFTTFFTTKEVGVGTGLGLSVTKSIIDTYGGQIYFESSSAGTTFFVELPKARKVTKKEKVKQDEPVKGLLTLVVDDEPEIRELLAETLEEHQCKVIAAASAQEALDLAKKYSFDLIITDVKMPGMDGITLLNELSKNKLASTATKIIITGGMPGDILSEDGSEYLSLINGLIHKPFDFVELSEVVKKAQKHRQELISAN